MTLRISSQIADEKRSGEYGSQRGLADNYLERVVKLVPAEALGVYPLLQNQAATLEDQVWASVLVAWVLLLVVIILRMQATKVSGYGSQWFTVFISSISFIIWVYVMDGDFGLFVLIGDVSKDVVDFIATLALIIWTILVPVFYKGDR